MRECDRACFDDIGRHRRPGFTLIELLIVIGIIALLLGILIPVVGSARAQARKVQCASNIRQLYMAVLSYTVGHNDQLPVPARVHGNGSPEKGPQYLCNMLGRGMIDYNVGSLWPYIGAVTSRIGLMNCPDDLGEMRAMNSRTTIAPRNFTYSFNGYLSGDINGLGHPIGLFDIKTPAHKIMVAEENHPNDSNAQVCIIARTPPYAASFAAPDVPAIRHRGRGNQGFADGHVECLYPVETGIKNDLSNFSDPQVAQSYWTMIAP